MSETIGVARPARGLFFAFLLGDALLLAVAGLVFYQAHRPMTVYEMTAVAVCTALAAWFGVWPFVLQQRAAESGLDRAVLAGTLAQLQRLEEVAERIGRATSHWQTAQEHAASAVAAARTIAERMTEEQRQFGAFLERSQNAQLQHLDLEVNKLRRAEGDWLQTLVRVLDHVYALYAAAMRSGQPQLAEQIGGFQNACREAARRVGLVPLLVPVGAPYDPQAHQPVDPNAPLPEQPVIGTIVGTGYSFQGQLLRRVVVTLRSASAATPEAAVVSADGVALTSRLEPGMGLLGSNSAKGDGVTDPERRETLETMPDADAEATISCTIPGASEARPGGA